MSDENLYYKVAAAGVVGVTTVIAGRQDLPRSVALGMLGALVGFGAASVAEAIVVPEEKKAITTSTPHVGNLEAGGLDPVTQILAGYGKHVYMDRPFAEALVRTANNLGISPYWLANVIRHESEFFPQAQYNQWFVMPDGSIGRGYRYNGTAVGVKFNPDGGATGLIGFIPSTAKALGTSTEDLFYMTGPQQLRYVEKYFAEKAPYKGRNDFYLAVFLPKGRGRPLATPLSAISEQAAERNPGTPTLGAYIDHLLEKSRLSDAGQVLPITRLVQGPGYKRRYEIEGGTPEPLVAEEGEGSSDATFRDERFHAIATSGLGRIKIGRL